MEPSTRFAILGNFKRGKTWLLDKLSGRRLPSHAVRHTVGICSTRVVIEGKVCYALDVKGENTPLSNLGELNLKERKAEESFIRDLVCGLSDAFVYMVGQVGYQEQLTLRLLVAELDNYVSERTKMTPTVIMVHNLRSIGSVVELEEAWEEIKQIYTQEGYKVMKQVEMNRSTNQEGEVEYLLKPLPAGAVTGVQVVHFFLGQEGTPAGKKNDITIQMMRRSMTGLLAAVERDRDFLKELVGQMKTKLPQYFTSNAGLGPIPGTKFDVVHRQGKIVLERALPSSVSSDASSCDDRMSEPPPGQPPDVKLRAPDVKLRDIHLGDFVAVSNRNVSLGGARYRVTTTCQNAVRVSIDLPGATESIIKASIASKADKDTRLLFLERSGSGVKILFNPGLFDRPLENGEKLEFGGLESSNARVEIAVTRWFLQNVLRPKLEVNDGVVHFTWEIDGDGDDFQA